MGRAFLHYEPNFESHWLIMKPIYRNFSEDMRTLCKRDHNFDIHFFSLKSSRNATDSKLSNSSLWVGQPTMISIIIYSIVTPIISTLGIIGNILILVVILKRCLKTSTYTYLAVLAGADLVTCTLLLFSGLARGIFWCKPGWLEFDAFVHLPLGSISSNITVWATVCVTIDRLAMVCSQPSCKTPKFCSQHIARRMMIVSTFFTIIINVPYCFMYKYNARGDLMTTQFFHSWLYKLQNWLQLMIFGLLPAIFLFIANSIMCFNMMKMLNQRKELLKRCNARECNQLRDQTRLTVMLVGIAFVFVVGEVPTHLASRRSAISLLYDGDLTIVHEVFLERFRIYATLLSAISSSFNFVLYSLLSPHFLSHLKQVLYRKSMIREGNTMRINAIVSGSQLMNVSYCNLFS
ncbi:hypothetical protein HZH66_004858 [Vespula vulgaris]|uniref:G-protein coupled receptors family 1 profile domain-containing protein n=1 Tax=Vespula vulgaris TaxID=7454 RepID=A0A834K9G2_VESVU|nr:mu-type opioid receptor [Vespula vulgaris]KAF7402591.1 hypothetical protein HZH66_004858 [Vespula vulgaris]